MGKRDLETWDVWYIGDPIICPSLSLVERETGKEGRKESIGSWRKQDAQISELSVSPTWEVHAALPVSPAPDPLHTRLRSLCWIRLFTTSLMGKRKKTTQRSCVFWHLYPHPRTLSLTREIWQNQEGMVNQHHVYHHSDRMTSHQRPNAHLRWNYVSSPCGLQRRQGNQLYVFSV